MLKSARLDRVRAVILPVLVLTALACNLPIGAAGSTATPTTATATETVSTSAPVTVVTSSPEPQAVCTPPACAPGEVAYCPLNDCPGGCGTICATPQPTTGAFVAPDAPDPNAEFEDISFFFDHTITPTWVVEIIPAQIPGSGPDAWLVPSHYLFTFPTYPVSNTYQPPRIMVFPVENWQGFNEHGEAEIDRLRQMLAAGSLDPGSQAGIPVVPIFNAAQVFRARPEFMSFQNGTGIRFITQYDQAANPITNQTIFYTFQGLTNDGLYYVAAFFPISHPGLPETVTDPAAVIGSDYTAYVTGIVQTLNDATQASFTPDLQTLDTMIQSLQVK